MTTIQTINTEWQTVIIVQWGGRIMFTVPLSTPLLKLEGIAEPVIYGNPRDLMEFQPEERAWDDIHPYPRG